MGYLGTANSGQQPSPGPPSLSASPSEKLPSQGDLRTESCNERQGPHAWHAAIQDDGPIVHLFGRYGHLYGCLPQAVENDAPSPNS